MKTLFINGGSDYENVNLYTNTSSCAKICSSLCLRMYAAIITWPGFDDAVNEAILRGINIYTFFGYINLIILFSLW